MVYRFRFENTEGESDVINIYVSGETEQSARDRLGEMLINPWGFKINNHIFNVFGSYVSHFYSSVPNNGYFYELRTALHGIIGKRMVSVFNDETKTGEFYDVFITR